MDRLEPHERHSLANLLSKLENRKVLMAFLFAVVLAKHKGNRTRTAKALGVSVRTIRNWLKKLPAQH